MIDNVRCCMPTTALLLTLLSTACGSDGTGPTPPGPPPPPPPPGPPGPPASTLVADYSGCPASSRPVWVGYRTDNGPWQQATPSGHVYQLPLSGTLYDVAYVFPSTGAAGHSVAVYLDRTSTLSETIGRTGPTDPCPMTSPTRDVAINFSGIDASQMGEAYLDGNIATSFSPTASGPMRTTPALLARRTTFGASVPVTDRLIFRPQASLPSAGTPLQIAFDGVDAFAPHPATITLSGVPAGFDSQADVRYYDGACRFLGSLSVAGGVPGSSPAMSLHGLPTARALADGFHVTAAYTFDDNGDGVLVFRYTRQLTSSTIPLPAMPGIPTMTALPGSHPRREARFSVPAAYNAHAQFRHGDNGHDFAIFLAASRYAGGEAVIATPDFSAAPGWNPAWAMAGGGTGRWEIHAMGATTGDPRSEPWCRDGNLVVTAQRGDND